MKAVFPIVDLLIYDTLLKQSSNSCLLYVLLSLDFNSPELSLSMLSKT